MRLVAQGRDRADMLHQVVPARPHVRMHTHTHAHMHVHMSRCGQCSAVQAVACAVCMRCTYTLYIAPSPAAPEGEMAPPATPRAAESQLGMQRDAVTAAAAAVTAAAAAAAVGGWPVIAPRAHRQHGRR